MTKPTEDLTWATNGTVNDIQEPTGGQRLSGIIQGGTWTRKRLNWMFKGIGVLSEYVKNSVLEAGTDGGQARTNTQNDARFRNATTVFTSGTVPVGRLPDADINNQGVVQLSQSVNNPSTTLAATSSAVRTAYNEATSRLKTGTGGLEGRTNDQNDARFGQIGTGATQHRTNTQNDVRFGLEGTSGSQHRTNDQNDSRFVQIANGKAARESLGIFSATKSNGGDTLPTGWSVGTSPDSGHRFTHSLGLSDGDSLSVTGASHLGDYTMEVKNRTANYFDVVWSQNDGTAIVLSFYNINMIRTD